MVDANCTLQTLQHTPNSNAGKQNTSVKVLVACTIRTLNKNKNKAALAHALLKRGLMDCPEAGSPLPIQHMSSYFVLPTSDNPMLPRASHNAA